MQRPSLTLVDPFTKELAVAFPCTRCSLVIVKRDLHEGIFKFSGPVHGGSKPALLTKGFSREVIWWTRYTLTMFKPEPAAVYTAMDSWYQLDALNDAYQNIPFLSLNTDAASHTRFQFAEVRSINPMYKTPTPSAE